LSSNGPGNKNKAKRIFKKERKKTTPELISKSKKIKK
jgi:hypothetical protein